VRPLPFLLAIHWSRRGHRPCPYRRKAENHYCGIHRNYSTLDRPLFGHAPDERWARLIPSGAALVVLFEKAAEYLPKAISLLGGSIGAGPMPDPEADAFEEHAETLESRIRDRDCQALADTLGYLSDGQIRSLDIPPELSEVTTSLPSVKAKGRLIQPMELQFGSKRAL